MTQLSWDLPTGRIFEQGISRGVLYKDTNAYPWSGLTLVSETPDNPTFVPEYYDGKKYINEIPTDSFGASTSAYTYPEELDENGYFNGFTYRTEIGDSFYKIHLVYNVLATPGSNQRSSIDDSTTVNDFTWDISTVPIAIDGCRPSAHLIIDTSLVPEGAILDLQDALYGTDTSDPRLPMPDEVVDIIGSAFIFTVTDLGDGIFRVTAPPGMLDFIDSTTVVLTASSVVAIDANTYQVSSS